MTKNNARIQKVIFVHLPKTAGTTLHMIIERHYAARNVFSTGAGAQKAVEEFKKMSDARRAEIHILKGHMAYGLHEYLPGSSAYITMLREPIDRTISFFYFVRQDPKHYHYDFIKTRNLSLEEYLESKISIMMDNTQVRLISGVWDEPRHGECTTETLEEAKRNLRENFAVVGLTERFDESLLLLKKAFGWHDIYYIRQNVTSNRPKKSELSPSTLRTLEKHNQLDMELYQYATLLFEEQLRRQGYSFAMRFKTFQVVNRLANPLFHIYQEVRKRSIRVFIRKWIRRIFQ